MEDPTPASAPFGWRAQVKELEAAGDLQAATALAGRAAPAEEALFWQARLSARAGRLAEAQAFLASAGPIDGWNEGQLRGALDVLATKPLFGAWIAVAHRLAVGGAPLAGELVKPVYNRLARIGSFFALTPAERTLADALWAQAPARKVLGFVSNERRARNVAGFLAAREPSEPGTALLRGIVDRYPEERAGWIEHMLGLHRRGSATAEELARFLAVVVAEPEALGGVCRQLIDRGSWHVLSLLSAARGTLVSRAVDGLAAGQIAAGAPWLGEQDLFLLRAAGLVPAITRSGPRLAEAIGDRELALARSITALTGPAGRCLDTAKRLAALGHRPEAAQLLAPVRDGSEPTAFRWAKLAGGGPREARTSAPWAHAYAARPSRRIRNGLAGALAEQDLLYAGAEALLRQSIAEAPTEPAAWRRLAILKSIAGDPAGEAQVLAEMENALPGDPWLATQRLRARLAGGDRAGVDAFLAQEEAGDADRAQLAAEVRLMRGDNAAASEAWLEAAERRGTPHAFYRHATALFQENRFEEAATRLEGLISRFPGFWRNHLKLAQARERFDEHERALAGYAQALALEPGSLDARVGIGRCLVTLGRHEDAAGWLDRQPDRRIDAGWVHALRALNFGMQGRGREAVAALAPLRSLARTYMVERAAAVAADPAAVWLDGRFVPHPHGEAAAHNRTFAASWGRLRAADGVALVGNAPSLLGGGQGRAIDANGCVIRLNDYQTQGFEADVGARTSIWYSAAARTARPRSGVGQPVTTWLYQERSYELPMIAGFSALRLGRAMGPPEACFLPPDIHHLSSRLIYPWPTSGLRMIGLLEFLADRPYTLHGFDFFAGERMHYYEPDNRNLHLGEFHAIRFERDFVERVLAEGSNLRRA